MPTVFFISPFQPPIWDRDIDFLIDVNDYAKRISQKWENSRVTINLTEETYVMSWLLSTTDGERLQAFSKEGQKVVTCQGTIKSVIEFVLWHREITENKYRLFLYDEVSTQPWK